MSSSSMPIKNNYFKSNVIDDSSPFICCYQCKQLGKYFSIKYTANMVQVICKLCEAIEAIESMNPLDQEEEEEEKANLPPKRLKRSPKGTVEDMNRFAQEYEWFNIYEDVNVALKEYSLMDPIELFQSC
jgi:hypothetical protein